MEIQTIQFISTQQKPFAVDINQFIAKLNSAMRGVYFEVTLQREVCIDPLQFEADGHILPVKTSL